MRDALETNPNTPAETEALAPPDAPIAQALPAPHTEDLGAASRRGLLFIPMAKLWFMIAGLLMQLLLPRALGNTALFGMWTLVLAWLSAPNNVVITGTIQTVAHFAAAGAGAVEQAKRTALRMNAILGGGVALGFFLLAPLIAHFEHDAELIPHLRLAAGVVLCYSFYAVFVGAANGARQFHKQAGLDMTFSALRTGLVLAAATVWHATLPAVGAFVLAAALILLLSVFVVGLPKQAPGTAALPVGRMVGFMASLMVYLAAINVLMFLDGWWLKRLCTEAALALGGAPAEVKASVDGLVGVYGAAQTVARLPYQLIVAVAFVVFPVLSTPALQADRARTQRYVTATLRYSLVAVLAMVVGLGVRPTATLRLLYQPEYATGAGALSILLAAYVCFSLLTITGTITNSLGRTKQTAALGVVTAALTAVSVQLSIRSGLAAHEQPLRAAALGLLVGMGVGLFLNLGLLWKEFRATLPPLTLLRSGVALLVCLSVGKVWPAAGTPGLLGSKVGTLICAGLSAVLYLVLLVVLRELSLGELRSMRRERPPADADAAAT